MTDSTLTVYFQQRIGAFDRIASLLRRRGFPITGIMLSRTHQAEIGRVTVAVGAPDAVEQVRRHLSKLPDVLEVQVHSEHDAVQREYALVRIQHSADVRDQIDILLLRYDARVVAESADHIVIEAAGAHDAIDALFADLTPFGIEESARTNPITVSNVADGVQRRSA